MILTMTNYDYLVEAISTPTEDCIGWERGKFGSGYGQVTVNGKKRGSHVVALELTKPRPAGKVCSVKGNWVPGHKLEAAHGPCHNRACFNPRHLSWKTKAENEADKKRDGTNNDNEKNGACKLSNADVARIRSLYKGPYRGPNRTGPSQYELADQFGCDQTQISSIVNNKKRV